MDRKTLRTLLAGKRRGSLLGVALCALLASALSASSAAAPATSSFTPAQMQQAIAAAHKDAAKLGPLVAAPTGKTIGFIHLSAQSSSSERMYAATKAAAAIFGFKVIACDPNFNPQRVLQCGTSMLAQHVNLIISVATEPGEFGASIAQAKAQGIPWINISGAVTPNKDVLPYNPDQVNLTKVYDAWLFTQMKKKAGSGPTLMAIGAPGVGLAARISEAQRKKDDAAAEIKEVVTHDLDLSNAAQDTLNTVNQTLTQYPDITGMWTICDFCVPLMAQAVDSKGLTGAKRPVISGMFTTPQTLADIRKGTVTGVVELPYEVSSWVAIDQALEHWARNKAFYPTQYVFTKAYSLKFLQPYIITKANVGTSSAPPLQGPDFVTYFKTKWKQEFGK